MEINEVLNLMTKKQRKIIKLWLKGFSQTKIAKKLNISPQAVSGHIKRALNKKNIKLFLKK